MPQIFIQSITDYNTGRILGQWVELDGITQDDLWDSIQSMLSRSKEPYAEEWEIADYDGFYGLSPSCNEVLQVSHLLRQHGEAYALYAHWVGETYASEDGFENCYCGIHESFGNYASGLFDELYGHEIPDYLRFYIDYDAWTRDLKSQDYHWDTDAAGKVHVFRKD